MIDDKNIAILAERGGILAGWYAAKAGWSLTAILEKYGHRRIKTMPTNKEIVKDKIRGDIEREKALEEAFQLTLIAVEECELNPRYFEAMSDNELLNWAKQQ